MRGPAERGATVGVVELVRDILLPSAALVVLSYQAAVHGLGVLLQELS